MHYPFFLIDIYNSIILTLLLTDISLENMDGIALAELIKSHIPNINIIFTSGYDQDALTNITSTRRKPTATIVEKALFYRWFAWLDGISNKCR